MNKGRRHEIKMLKYKKRLRNLNLKEGEGNFYAFRSHGKPCSCSVCRNSKYDRRDNDTAQQVATYKEDREQDEWDELYRCLTTY